MTTMWLILPSAALAGDAPAAGNAVRASSDASAAGTMIRTRGLIKVPPPCYSPVSEFPTFRFTRRGGRNQEDSVKALSTWLVPGGGRRRVQVDALRHLHWNRSHGKGGNDDRRGGPPRRRGVGRGRGRGWRGCRRNRHGQPPELEVPGGAARGEVRQRQAVGRPGGRGIETAVNEDAGGAQGGAVEGGDLEPRSLFPASADHRQLRAVGRECRLAAVIGQGGQWLSNHVTDAALEPDLGVHRGGLIDRMLHEKERGRRQGDRAGVAARIEVRIGATARLVLRSIQRHAPNREVVAGGGVNMLGTVVTVEEGRTVRRHARVKSPMVELDVARIILGQALDHMAVEVEQVEIAREVTAQDCDQMSVVGGERRLRPIAARADFGEATVLELEQPAVLDDKHRARQGEPWLCDGGLLGRRLD